MCGFFKRKCLGLQKFLPLTHSLLVFAATSCEDLSSWPWNAGLEVLGWSGTSCSPDSPPKFYPPNVDVGPVCSPYLPLLPVWVDVVSLIP